MVTGSCGFIGHHLVRALRARKIAVVGVDNLSNGDEAYAMESSIFLRKNVGQLTEGDIRGCDTIFHMAALPRVPYSIEHPRQTHDANVNQSLHLYLTALDAGVQKVVYSSSSSVYGDITTFPTQESVSTTPISPYAVQKLTAEHYAEVFRRVYGLKTASLRYFNVYGEEQDETNPYTGVVTRFLRLRSEGKPLTIYGNGSQRRDFTYVGDVVEANILAAEKGEGVYNCGSGVNHSILDIAKAIDGDITFGPPRSGDPALSLADNSRLRALGWEPRGDLMVWLKNRLKSDVMMSSS